MLLEYRHVRHATIEIRCLKENTEPRSYGLDKLSGAL